MMAKHCYNENMGKPISFGLLLGLVVCISGCRTSNSQLSELAGTQSGSGYIDVSLRHASNSAEASLPTQLPLDAEAKQSGHKVFAKVSTKLLRSPREGATPYYQVDRGTALYVRPMDDKRWLEVSLSKGRRVYVKTDETTALALALAQGSLADKQRLEPKSKQDQQVDDGDGKGGGPSPRDPALDAAIADTEEVFKELDLAWDRFRAEANAFQMPGADWVSTRDVSLQRLSVLVAAHREFEEEVRSLTALSSNFTASERTAYQALVMHQDQVNESIEACSQALNQMVDDSDWIQPIEAFLAGVQSLGGGIDGLRVNLAKLG